MNYNILNKYRQKEGPWKTQDTDKHGLFFVKTLKGNILKCLSSGDKDPEWYHVSVSLPNRCPTWEEMCLVKELFYGDEMAIQYHPKKEDYINNHPFCLHLWQNKIEEIKTPSSLLVGVKEREK